MKNLPFFQKNSAMSSLIMVVFTITLLGLVGFRFLDAQDNREVATKQTQTNQEVAAVTTVKDVETVSKQLDTTELDTLDAELDSQFDF